MNRGRTEENHGFSRKSLPKFQKAFLQFPGKFRTDYKTFPDNPDLAEQRLKKITDFPGKFYHQFKKNFFNFKENSGLLSNFP